MKREGISTILICSYLRALSFYLTLKYFCEGVLVWCKFKIILKTPLFLANFVMIIISIRMYTKFWF